MSRGNMQQIVFTQLYIFKKFNHGPINTLGENFNISIILNLILILPTLLNYLLFLTKYENLTLCINE